MSFYAFNQVSKESYETIARNYFKFIGNCNDPDKETVSVFTPLSEKMLGELELIREVSKDLQKKKIEEDQKAIEAEENAKKEKEEKKEEEKKEKDKSEVNESEEQNREEKNE